MTQSDPLVRTVLLVLLVLLLLPFAMMLVAMPLMGITGWSHMGHGWTGDGMSGWWMLVWMAVPLLVLLGAGYLVARALNAPDEGETDEAMEELRRAYARGEFSDEEFQRRRERLRENFE